MVPQLKTTSPRPRSSITLFKRPFPAISLAPLGIALTIENPRHTPVAQVHGIVRNATVLVKRQPDSALVFRLYGGLDHERLASVNHQGGAIDVTGPFRDQKTHGIGNVVAGADAARWDGLDQLLQDGLGRCPLRPCCRLQELIGARRLDAAGGDAVHPDVQRTNLHREFFTKKVCINYFPIVSAELYNSN